MKKKIYAFLAIFAVLFLLPIGSSFIFDKLNIIFYAQAFLVAVMFFVAFLLIFKKKSNTESLFFYANKHFGDKNARFCNNLPLPVVITDKEETVVWANNCFFSSVSLKSGCIGESIRKLINGLALKDIKSKDFTPVKIKDRNFNITVSDFNKGYALLFVDTTEYTSLSKKYEETRLCVATVNFDNREELVEKDGESGIFTQILANVESHLSRWVISSGGFLKKMSNERYLVIFEDRKLQENIENKFDILDKIRNDELLKKYRVTVSIGVGCQAKSFDECEKSSRKALDMALGRGGDQVVVKNNDRYRFFGGVSSGVEKRDRIKVRIVAATLAENIKNSDKVIIMGHRFSDLDCVGASLGLSGIVKKLSDTPSYIVTNTKQSLADVMIDYAQGKGCGSVFISAQQAKQLMSENTLLVIVDTHSENLTEDSELVRKSKNLVIIDHHRMVVNHIKNASVFFHDPSASSASEMVADLCRYMGERPISEVEANALLAGIMLDTKNFVFKTGVRTFEAAAYLKEIGADTVEVKKLFADTLETYCVKYKIVARAKIYNGYAISCVDELMEKMNISAAQAADELLGIQGVKASFVIYKTPVGVSVSARSLGDVNVQVLLEKLGGGGHQTMAGAQVKNANGEEVKKKLLKVIYKKELEIKTKLENERNAKEKEKAKVKKEGVK